MYGRHIRTPRPSYGIRETHMRCSRFPDGNNKYANPKSCFRLRRFRPQNWYLCYSLRYRLSVFRKYGTLTLSSPHSRYIYYTIFLRQLQGQNRNLFCVFCQIGVFFRRAEIYTPPKRHPSRPAQISSSAPQKRKAALSPVFAGAAPNIYFTTIFTILPGT